MTIKEELLALKNDDGLIVVEEVWQWAKENEGSDLHKSITWDVDEAAKNYQFWQIRKLVRLHIVSEQNEPQIISLSLDRRQPAGGYRDMRDVMAAPLLRQVALTDALRELEAVRKKYEHLSELAAVWSAVNEVKNTSVQPQPSVA
jgi:hypothetical protein